VFENRVMIIFGPQRTKVKGGWSKLHNEELHNVYSSPYVIMLIKSRKMRCERNEVVTAEMRNAHTILVVKPEG
jgi:hypothetical protein